MQAGATGAPPGTSSGGAPPLAPPPEGWPSIALLVLGSGSLPAMCRFPPPGAGALAALQASAAGILGGGAPRLFAAIAGMSRCSPLSPRY